MATLYHDEAEPPAGTSRVGAELCAARLRLGWELPDVSASLRIRLPFLQAIEDGRIADLPGNAYAIGFVRTYANSLGLDPDEVARRFRIEAQNVTRKTELTFPAPVPQRGVPAMAVVLLGIVIAAVAYAGWYRYTGSSEGSVAQMPSSPPERLAALAPLTDPSSAASTTPIPALPAISPQVASLLPSALPTNAAKATVAAALPVRPGPPPNAAPVAVPPAPITLPPPAATRLVIHAKAGGWVQVRERQGQVLLNRVLRAGEIWPVPMKPQLLLTTSNAGAMELLVDGVPAPSLGAMGAVRRDVPLDPATIAAAKPATLIHSTLSH